MRTGAHSVQQALTAEAASVLKQSLSLARRRGHAQVTPLHVAATLLSSSSSSSPCAFTETSGLLRRACLKSHPHHPASHPLQCRALELCFNVALNRLPTTPPPSSSPLTHHPHPSLSNALIAALKRAQAHQRRGSIEQQQQQQQQQQPLLAIKVELEQLIISILDDPSVSRVMREAGFSSTCVKANIEHSSSSSSSSPSSFLFEPHFLKPASQKEDLKMVFDVMLRKQGRRRNTVVVGDSVASTEGLVSEFIGRMERGEVPDELKCCCFVRFHLSPLQLRLMNRNEAEMKVTELRKKIGFLGNGGVIVNVGDLKWVVDEEIEVVGGGGFRPVEHLVSEMGKLLLELSEFSGKVWLMATASYQTFMKCKMRQPSLEIQWGLQAVVAPSSGLALSLQSPSGLDSKVTKLVQCPFQMLDSKALHLREEQEKLMCCTECTLDFEKEASISKDYILPSWLQPNRTDSHNKDSLAELRRKWSRLCQSLHHSVHKQTHPYPPFFGQSLVSSNSEYASSVPWWSKSSSMNQNRGNWPEKDVPKQGPSEVRTTLALGIPFSSDSATSKDSQKLQMEEEKELLSQLQDNIPWQSETIPSIIEALVDCHLKKGSWLLLQGDDQIAKQRLARVAAKWFCGSSNSLIHIDGKCSESASTKSLTEALSKNLKHVVFIENIDRTPANFTKLLSESLQDGFLRDQIGGKVDQAHAIFILSTSNTEFGETIDENFCAVLKMRLCTEEPSSNPKRKQEAEMASKSKKPKTWECKLDLNICTEEDQDVPSDLTQETTDCGDLDSPHGFLESIATHIALNAGQGRNHYMSEKLQSKLRRAFEEVHGISEATGEFSVDQMAAKRLVEASGSFTEEVFDKWLKEVFQTGLESVEKGGKVRLLLEGKEGNAAELGFRGSSLPCRIRVE